jgi:hypothetical protein
MENLGQILLQTETKSGIVPQTLETKYKYFENRFQMLDYINTLYLVFEDNKQYTLKLTIIPNKNELKQEIIKNYIWVVDQYFNMN